MAPLMTTEESAARILAFLTAEMPLDDIELTTQTALLGDILDSIALIEVVGFLEDEFEVELADTDITRSNFETIDAIANLVALRRSTS